MEERIIELETKVSYQDNTIAELNEVVTTQQQQIDHLEKGLLQLREHMGRNSDTGLARPDEDVPPPHY